MQLLPMTEIGGTRKKQHASVLSHRCLHSSFTPTHLTLGSTSDSKELRHAVWQSRRSRKARYSPVPHIIANDPSPEKLSTNQQTQKTIRPHLILDVTFWLAVTFTFGSAIWVINGFLVWFPNLMPKLGTTAFTNTAAATGFIGGSVFELGSYLMVVEALRHGRETSASTALGQCFHDHRYASYGSSPDLEKRALNSSIPAKEGTSPGTSVWWGKPLWHDIGYVAALIQLLAATVFWISTLTGLPGVIKGIYGDDGSTPIIDVFFWTPQVVGGTGFILSSLLLMLETQLKWYKPNWTDIGWHIGAWNFVGSVGFTLCGALGYASKSSEGAAYQSALSTWWGAWAFFFGSVLQLVEAVWREKPDGALRND